MNDLYLMHHGVKGMKWGVRKKQIKSSNIYKTSNREQKRNMLNKAYGETHSASKIGLNASAKILAGAAATAPVAALATAAGPAGLPILAGTAAVNLLLGARTMSDYNDRMVYRNRSLK